jgi:hypothetical protein
MSANLKARRWALVSPTKPTSSGKRGSRNTCGFKSSPGLR